uniref:SPASM domain-containing protein n=1 Tax=Ascaris lumbricoides TaxID=6252 RepID=A0A0M3IX67_ASCLU
MLKCSKGCTKIPPMEFHNLVVLANRRLGQNEREMLNPRLYDPYNSSIMKGHSGYICGNSTVLNNLRFSVLKEESFWHQLLQEGTYKHSRYLYANSDCANKCKWPIFPSTCQMVTYNDEIIKELYFRRMPHMILFECNT